LPLTHLRTLSVESIALPSEEWRSDVFDLMPALEELEFGRIGVLGIIFALTPDTDRDRERVGEAGSHRSVLSGGEPLGRCSATDEASAARPRSTESSERMGLFSNGIPLPNLRQLTLKNVDFREIANTLLVCVEARSNNHCALGSLRLQHCSNVCQRDVDAFRCWVDVDWDGEGLVEQ